VFGESLEYARGECRRIARKAQSAIGAMLAAMAAHEANLSAKAQPGSFDPAVASRRSGS
jgi:hypothetical protein